MAKKRKSPSDLRTETVNVPVSRNEKKMFVKLAGKKRLPLSELIRQELYRAADFEKLKQLQNA